MVARFDFVARQGDTFRKTFNWKDGDGNPKEDLTGYEIEFSVAPAPGSRPRFQYSLDDFISLDGPNASWTVEIPFTETRKWPRGRLRYEMTLLAPDDFRFTKIEGMMVVGAELVK